MIKEYKKILLKNISKGMGENWFQFYLFLIASPIYMLWILLLSVVLSPFIYLDCKREKKMIAQALKILEGGK